MMRYGMGRLAGIGLMLLLVGVLGWRLSGIGQAPEPVSGRTPAAATNATLTTLPAAADAVETANADAVVPRSLQGSQVDGALRFDAQGRLVLDAELRRYFDWFLAALGEQDLATIRKRMAADLALRANPEQILQVLGWFDRYVDYLQATARLGGQGQSLRERLKELKALRMSLLGAQASEGFYGQEQREAERVLAQRELAERTDLDEAQRLDEQERLLAASPDYAQALAQVELEQRAQALDRLLNDLNAGESERYQLREAQFGAEAARRFTELDQQRTAWQSRLQQYGKQRQALAQRNLSQAQQHAEQQRLLASFNEAERRRILAMEEAGLLQ